MTDYTMSSNEEKASEFIVSTCQLHPKSYPNASDAMHNLAMSRKPAPLEYFIRCGSSVEFYIEPWNSCISEYDLILCRADELTFSGVSPLLPSDMSGLAETIRMSCMESYQMYPGFVRLRSVGEMRYDWTTKNYGLFIVADHLGDHIVLNKTALSSSIPDPCRRELSGISFPNIVCGPAIKYQPVSDFIIGSDVVKSVFCPQWPKEAESWPIRSRKSGWPTIDTISEVVQNGCHVVNVQHRSCRDDELQWRLSFSLAEVILIQSWTKTQQIVYHLLRFLAKRELIQKDCPKEDEVICTYHLKTLMLWTCEEMLPEWWNSFSVIRICCELLRTLSKWLKRKYYPNYFIPEANLFHQPSSYTMLDMTEKRLNKFRNSSITSQWFVENYILPKIRSTVFQGFNGVVQDFMDCMQPILNWRKRSEIKSLNVFLAVLFSESSWMCRCAIKYGLTAGLGMSVRHEPTSFDPTMYRILTYISTTEKLLCYKYYAYLLHILHTAYSLRYGEISWENSLFVEFVQTITTKTKIIRSKYHNFPKSFAIGSSRFHLLRAHSLMENLTESKGHPEFQLMSVLSKAFLTKALECDDWQINSCIAPAAVTYLAALYFATSEYQPAIRFCLAIIKDQINQREEETLNASCLLFIDDIARIVGLCVLHKKIRPTKNNLDYIGRRLYLDLRLSPKVFAHYVALLSSERISKQLYFYGGLPELPFPMDRNVMTLVKQKYYAQMQSGTLFNATKQLVYHRADSVAEIEVAAASPLMVKETVIDALMECALENVSSFFNAIRRDFGIQCNTADCYRALYLYRCHKYDEVWHLCENVLRESDLESDLKKFAFANIMLIPPFGSFFDTDLQSLLGFHTLFYYLSPRNDDLLKFKITGKSTFGQIFAHQVYFYGKRQDASCSLTSSLITPHYVSRQYFLGRHFLARYLKARCCIDSNLPNAEALTEFALQKFYFPFERIIRRFLLQKLRVRRMLLKR